MRKINNFQDLADKAIESAIKWATEDSLKEDKGFGSYNYAKMVEDFNDFTEQKYGSPHDFVVIKDEMILNRYDEVFYIMSEAMQRNLLAAQVRELNIALLVIADSIDEFEQDEESDEAANEETADKLEEIQPQFDDEVI